MNPRERKLDEQEHWLANLFSTHPPVRKRLELLLQQAHLGLPALEERLEERSREERVAQPAQVSSSPERWMAYEKGDWKGPFTMEQLIGLDWVSPNVWIWRTGLSRIVRAGDDELLQKVFRTRIPGGSLSDSSCPECHQPLRVVEYEGTWVESCSFCGGALVEDEKLSRIIAREERQFTPRQMKLAREWEARMAERPEVKDISPAPRISCPRCNRRMHRRLYSYQYFIPIDQCFTCHCIWFDRDELELLQILIEKHRK